MVAQVAEEVHYPDGRVGLASTDEIAGSGYANGDLAPLPLAFGVGAVLAVGGAGSAPGQGPFPQDGLIPALKPLYNHNWVVGFGAALLLYWGLTAMSAGRSRVPEHAYAGDR
jgi:cytosine/uracil/thiamine/allantoin permease